MLEPDEEGLLEVNTDDIIEICHSIGMSISNDEAIILFDKIDIDEALEIAIKEDTPEKSKEVLEKILKEQIVSLK